MTIKIKVATWGEAIIIETPRGKAKVSCNWNNDIEIKGEDILIEYGISVSDAIAMFFDRAANSNTRDQYRNYLDKMTSKKE